MAVPPPATIDDKTALRGVLRARRDAFVAGLSDPVAAAAGALARLEPLLANARCVAAYVPLGSEFPALAALARAADLGAATALPRVDRRGEPLRFLPWRPGEPLERGYFGLQQPREAEALVPDLVLAPLSGFDRALARLGQGAGFYDRWFADHPASRRIGLAWHVQEVQRLPVDSWDMPLHAIVTENEWIGPPS